MGFGSRVHKKKRKKEKKKKRKKEKKNKRNTLLRLCAASRAEAEQML